MVEIFLKVLQGSYAYLLIFQILVVTGLFLALIWLVIRRTQEAALLASAPSLTALPVDHVAMAPPPPSIAPEPVPPVVVNGIPEAEHEKLKTELTALKSENEKLKTANPESQSLKDKVTYLESRLIEYEILQEEIGSLSQLKLENEKIKQELMQMKARAFASGSSTSEVPAMITTPESVTPEQKAGDLPPAAVVTPEMGMPTSASNPTAKETLGQGQEAASTEGLEGLLDQIDKLTAPADK